MNPPSETIFEPPFEIDITDLARGGSGVGRTAEGMVVFVPFTAPGDRVRAQLSGKPGKSFSHAKLVEVIRPSPKRVRPPCAVFGRCGGCEWQHIPYGLQWETKLRGLGEVLKRAQFNPEVVTSLLATLDAFPATAEYGYRNRVQLRGESPAHSGQPSILGFYGRGSNQIVDLQVADDRCEISRTEINAELARVRGELERGEMLAPNQGFKLELDYDLAHPEAGVRRFLNSPHAAGGFRQVNDAQNERLRHWVHGQLVGARLVLDLYGGAGNLSDLFISLDTVSGSSSAVSPKAQVLCVDVSAPAQASSAQRTFVQKPVRRWIEESVKLPPIESAVPPNERVCIIDPPREGVADDLAMVAEELRRQRISKIIAVGCDADAWSRDLRKWNAAGWQIQKLAAFDLFPQTPHVEACAVLVSGEAL